MKRTLMIAILPAVIVGFVFGYTVRCGAQSPGNREDEEAIKKVIAGTTGAFNQHDAKAFRASIPRTQNWLPCEGSG